MSFLLFLYIEIQTIGLKFNELSQLKEFRDIIKENVMER